MSKGQRSLVAVVFAVVAFSALGYSLWANVLNKESSSSHFAPTPPRDPNVPEDFETSIDGPKGIGPVYAFTQRFDLSDLAIPEEQISVVLYPGKIRALTDRHVSFTTASGLARRADWEDDRVVVVRDPNDERNVMAVPLRIISQHEVMDTWIGSEPIAVTYCPLCDSAAVFSRRFDGDDSTSEVLTFSVTGGLWNSNLLMYDTTSFGLWSQVGMRAVSGPYVGESMRTLPSSVMTVAEFATRWPQGQVVSDRTGRKGGYRADPYGWYYKTEELLGKVAIKGPHFEKGKTMGVGVKAGDSAWFIARDAIEEAGQYELQTPAGTVLVGWTEGGVEIRQLPSGVDAMPTFYFAWYATYPQTEVVGAEPAADDA